MYQLVVEDNLPVTSHTVPVFGESTLTEIMLTFAADVDSTTATTPCPKISDTPRNKLV